VAADNVPEVEMAAVNYDELELTFDFVSSAGLGEHRAYVSLDTEKLHWVSAENPLEEDDLPDDLESSNRYVAVPHKNELDLGRELALRFAAETLPNRYRDIQDCFRRRGAYARFKDILDAAGHLDGWYRFEADSTERALREWCAANGIEVTVSDAGVGR
jgi:hypothetical protein